MSTGCGSFDQKYMAEMVSEHGEAARLYRQESERGLVTSLKELASKLLPTVQQHESRARETAGKIGAEVPTAQARDLLLFAYRLRPYRNPILPTSSAYRGSARRGS